jgi:two-component system NtrC family sensor kinase
MRRRNAALELIGLTALVMVGLLGAFMWLTLRWQRSWQLDEVQNGLALASETLRSGLRYGMMENRRDEVRATIERVAHRRGIERVRLIEHRGRITLSTRDGDRDRFVDLRSPGCTICHAGPAGSVSPLSHGPEAYTVLEGKSMRAFTPIIAEQGCITGACHQQEARSKVLGVIEVLLSLDDVEVALSHRQLKLAGASAVAIVSGGGLLWLALTRRFRRPMRKLLLGIRRVAQGEPGYRIRVQARDEFGELAESFNAMSQRLSEVQASLIQSERLISMGKLAAGVAHEINNPLTGVVSYAEDLLEDAKPEDPRRKDYEVIVHEALRCRQIVRNLLDFARQDTPSFAHVRPAEVIQRALDVVVRLAAFRNIRFERRIDEDAPLVEADPVQIQQVLINLIVNAQQAMVDGGTIVVGARASAGGERVEFWVQDQGCGIPEEIRARIFEPFFSTKGGKTDGLGLAVCLGIVQQHGGSIDLESAVGRGTTFRVALPVSRTAVAIARQEGVSHA